MTITTAAISNDTYAVAIDDMRIETITFTMDGYFASMDTMRMGTHSLNELLAEIVDNMR